MSLNGIAGTGSALLRPYEGIRPKGDQEKLHVGNPAQTVAARPAAAGAGLLAPRQDALPVDAPAGTDPELWQVLNSAERAYFAKVTSMGPLTYGRQTTPHGSGAGLSNGGDLVRGLYGAPDAYGTYRPEARTHGETEAAGGLLINRHA